MLLKQAKKTQKIFILFTDFKMEYSDGLEERDEGQIHNGEVNVRWGIKK